MAKICPKCGGEYPDNQPYCARDECLRFLVKEVIDQPTMVGRYMRIFGRKYLLNGIPEIEKVWIIATGKKAIISIPMILRHPLRVILHPIDTLAWFISEIHTAELIRKELPDHKYCRSGRELLRVGKLFLSDVPEAKRKWYRDAFYFLLMVWEYDAAYRQRGQDIIPLIDKISLRKNPRKELLRVARIGNARERSGHVMPKRMLLTKVLSFLLLFPSKTRKFIVKFVRELDLGEIMMDDNDKYWVANRFDYNYNGQTYDERMVWRNQEDATFVEDQHDPKQLAFMSVNPNSFFYELEPEDAKKFTEKAISKIMEQYTAFYSVRNKLKTTA